MCFFTNIEKVMKTSVASEISARIGNDDSKNKPFRYNHCLYKNV